MAKLSSIQAVRDYVSRMCTDVPGMKVLIMDAETTGIVSMAYTQTQILQHEVFLIDSIERGRPDKMAHLKAVYFIRPTAANIALLQEEFRDPRYGEYHLFFSYIVRDGMVQQLAEADEHEVVQKVQEYFADYLAINPELFSLNVPAIFSGAASGSLGWDQPVFNRIQEGLCSLLLALKRRPTIRYQRSSETALRLAEQVLGTMETESDLFGSRRSDTAPLLLIIDRRDDPVTPLLNQWTYQAMVHELIGISNNRVDLRGRPSVPKELEQIVLSAEQDAFFADNFLLNYGDLACNVKGLLDAFQAKTKSSKDISSIADMQAFCESYPQFRKLSGDVSKHVTLLGEINRLVEVGCLMEVSQVEQELACTEDHSSAASEVDNLLSKPSISEANKLRVVLLYALRYERHTSSRVAAFKERLGPEAAQMVDKVLSHCGAAHRSGDLFSNKSLAAVLKKSMQRGLKGVENVYTQHSPLLAQTLEGLVKGSLPETNFPWVGDPGPSGSGSKRKPPTEIFVFMVGGATYEEARCAAEMNAANPGVRIVLGGTTVHNSASFLEELAKMPMQSGAPPPAAADGGSSIPALTSGFGGMGIAAPPIDRKRLAAGISGLSSTMQSGFNTAMSKLQ